VRILLVGSGGREHALAWALTRSSGRNELHAAPGNPGIAEVGACHPVRAEDVEGVVELARALAPDLVVVGPEAPLVAGVADELRQAGIPTFGPGAGAARIEASKGFAKEVMQAAGVPTAGRLPVARPPCVVKLDGLAAGKGVFVCRSEEELDRALRAVTAAGRPFFVEELLEGEEVSLLALAAGVDAIALPAARDFKRRDDGDEGPNTGGMGSYSPVSSVGRARAEELLASVHRPVLAELAARGTPFVGVLYAGLMLTAEGPRVLEFNCRFGDPETQSILPRLGGDIADALAAAAARELTGVELREEASSAVTVVLAAGAYPDDADRGTPIGGVDDARREGALVFHAGTARHGDRLVTNGGRVLAVTGVGETLAGARRLAYAGCERISFPGVHYRRDVAAAASRLEEGGDRA
jgi:phosphoribosylamine---glycine ligase